MEFILVKFLFIFRLLLSARAAEFFSVGVIDDEGWRSSTTLNWISHCFDFDYFSSEGAFCVIVGVLL